MESEILSLLDLKGRIRRRDLIQYLMDNHPEERGYSVPTISRKIAGLKKSGKIAIISGKDLATFGISDADKRATYLISNRTIERKKHFDEVIRGIPTGNRDEIHAALFEILLYKSTYYLTPEQLDVIVLALDQDYKVAYIALQILYFAADKRGELPSNTEIFKKKLKDILKRFRDDPRNRSAIRHAVHLLGYMKDNAIVEQLAHDAPLFDDDRVRKEEYMYPVMVEVIENNRTALFELEKLFMKQNNEEAAKAIHQIREYALDPEKYEKEMKKRQEEGAELL